MNSAINKFLESRVEVVTGMNSSEIHALGEELNSRAFYVAKLTSHKLNAEYRKVSDQFSRKEISLTDAKTYLKKFVGNSQSEIAQNLTRSARIKQVLENQRACARAVGEYASVARTKERYPYIMYMTNRDGFVRQTHKALDGMIFRVDDPFIQSHWPGAWDYNCRCTFKRMTAAEVEGKRVQEMAEKPTYDAETKAMFNVANSFENDLSEVKDREIMVKDLTEMVRHGNISKMGLVLSRADQPYNSANVALSKVTQAMEKTKQFAQKSAQKANWSYVEGEDYRVQVRLFEQNNPNDKLDVPQELLDEFPDEGVSFGKVSTELAKDIGLNDSAEIILSSGNRDFGLKHNWLHHKEVFIDPKLGEEILKKTIGNKSSKVTISLSKERGKLVKRIAWFDEKSNSFCVGIYDDTSKKLELVSWHRANQDYVDNQWKIRKK